MKKSLQPKTGDMYFWGRNLPVNDEQKEQTDWLEDKKVHTDCHRENKHGEQLQPDTPQEGAVDVFLIFFLCVCVCRNSGDGKKIL